MSEFDPKDHIDRLAEQQLFLSLVVPTTPARMLTVSDRGGRGKSSFLRRLRYNCQRETPPIPVCLLELDKLSDPSPFTFARAVAHGFVARGIDVKECFMSFNDLYGAVRVEVSFDRLEGQSSVVANANAAVMKDSSRNIAFNMEHAEVSVPMITGEQVERVRAECIEAFFADLRRTCAELSMVLLLDGWENCNLTLRRWIVEEMFANHVFHLDPRMRPGRLSIVIAGRPHEPVRTPHGLRSDDFREYFSSDAEYSSTVLSIPPLESWEPQHASDFLILAGCPEPTDAQISVVQEQVAKGTSLEKIHSLAYSHFRPDGAS